MADVEISYCTREAVQRELAYSDSLRLNKRVDDKIRQASRDVEGLCHRRFYPWTGTRNFDVPETDTLWLYQHEIAELDSIVSGDVTMTTDDYVLRPESGPPYGWVDINWGGSVGWQAAPSGTWQRAIAITGTFGYPVTQVLGAGLAASADTSATSLTLDDSAEVGVGSLILAGSERMMVTGKTLAASGATLATDLDASKASVQVTVSDGDVVGIGELIAIDGERMYVEAVAGDVLTVLRGQNGSTLAAHTSGATVYAPRIADVARGQQGTVSASHDSGSAIYLLQPPSLVSEYVLALACAALEHGSSGYARTAGTSESRRDVDDRGINTLHEDVYTRHGRKVRSRAV